MPVEYKTIIKFADDGLGNEIEFSLVLENVSSSFERAVVIHEFAGSDGALTEDLGEKAAKFSFRAYFESENRKDIPSLAEGYLFRNFARLNPSLVSLVHPSLGSLSGRITATKTAEGDEVDSLFVDFDFVEDKFAEATISVDVNPVEETEQDFQIFAAKAAEEFEADLAEIKPGGSDAAKIELEEGKSFLEYLNGYSRAVREFARDVDSSLGSLDGLANEIQNPATSIIAVTNYATTIGGRVVDTISKTCERYKELYTTVENAPGRFASNLGGALDELASVFQGTEVGDSIKKASGSVLAWAFAENIEKDEEARREQVEFEEAQTFDALGRVQIAPRRTTADGSEDTISPPPLASVFELETGLYETRKRLQVSVDIAEAAGGDVEPYKSAALTLQDSVIQTKLEFEKVRKIEVLQPTPIHRLLVNEGLNYKTDERVLALNDIKNPNFIEGEVLIYER